jgi:hypothetical protein
MHTHMTISAKNPHRNVAPASGSGKMPIESVVTLNMPCMVKKDSARPNLFHAVHESSSLALTINGVSTFGSGLCALVLVGISLGDSLAGSGAVSKPGLLTDFRKRCPPDVSTSDLWELPGEILSSSDAAPLDSVEMLDESRDESGTSFRPFREAILRDNELTSPRGFFPLHGDIFRKSKILRIRKQI